MINYCKTINFYLTYISFNDLPSTPSTVLGKALRDECEVVNACACLKSQISINELKLSHILYRRKWVRNVGSVRAQPVGLTVNGISNNCNRPYLNA